MSNSRISALDVFRGLTMAGMIVIDNQGDFSHVYTQLDEGIWNGFRFCNTIFPAFLGIMGAAIPIALRKRRNRPIEATLKLVLRSLKLVVIGVLLNLVASKFHVHGFRIMGVLQRLGVAYLFTATTYVWLPLWAFRVLNIACPVTYTALQIIVPLGAACAGAHFTPQCNLGATLDRAVFGRYMLHPNDPEGLLSTLGAVANVHAGAEIGLLLLSLRAAHRAAETRALLSQVDAADTCTGASAASAAAPPSSPFADPYGDAYGDPYSDTPYSSEHLGFERPRRRAGCCRTFWRAVCADDHTTGGGLYAPVTTRWRAVAALAAQAVFWAGAGAVVWIVLDVPVNKKIWTASFAWLSAATTAAGFLLVFAAVDASGAYAAGDRCVQRVWGTAGALEETIEAFQYGAVHRDAAPPGGIADSDADSEDSAGGAGGDGGRGCCGIASWCRRAWRVGPAGWAWASVQPLRWLGLNPLAVFVLMVSLGIVLMDLVRVRGGSTSAWHAMTEQYFRPWIASPRLASLVVSLANVALWTLVAGGMHAMRWYVKA